MLEVNITKKLHSFVLHADFALACTSLGLSGSSGSGKSMTLKCIAGTATPDNGRIVLDGKVLFDSAKGINLPPQQRHIGYLFQNYALFPNMTALENVCCGPLSKNCSREQAGLRARELLAKFRLEQAAELYPRQLSGGQRQRVALARMLAAEPEVLLLDEPMAALDAELKEAVQVELRQLLHTCARPAIIVSHDKKELAYLSDKVLHISEGVLLEQGK